MMARWLSKYTVKTSASTQRGWPTMGKDEQRPQPGQGKKTKQPAPDYRKGDFLRDLKKVSRRLEDQDKPRRSSRQD
jgi:hypothetical protein